MEILKKSNNLSSVFFCALFVYLFFLLAPSFVLAHLTDDTSGVHQSPLLSKFKFSAGSTSFNEDDEFAPQNERLSTTDLFKGTFKTTDNIVSAVWEVGGNNSVSGEKQINTRSKSLNKIGGFQDSIFTADESKYYDLKEESTNEDDKGNTVTIQNYESKYGTVYVKITRTANGEEHRIVHREESMGGLVQLFRLALVNLYNKLNDSLSNGINVKVDDLWKKALIAGCLCYGLYILPQFFHIVGFAVMMLLGAYFIMVLTSDKTPSHVGFINQYVAASSTPNMT